MASSHATQASEGSTVADKGTHGLTLREGEGEGESKGGEEKREKKKDGEKRDKRRWW